VDKIIDYVLQIIKSILSHMAFYSLFNLLNKSMYVEYEKVCGKMFWEKFRGKITLKIVGYVQ